MINRFSAKAAIILLSGFWIGATGTASEAEEVWNRVQKGELVVLMRHALAPGTGDPADFDLDDCTTQRNLSKQGRKDARAIGAFLKTKGLQNARVLTSQWCRCRDTARLLDIGKVRELPALNSFYGRPEQKAKRLKQLEAWFQKVKPGRPVVLVTHQVTITARTGVFPASGEMIIVDPTRPAGRPSVVMRVPPDQAARPPGKPVPSK